MLNTPFPPWPSYTNQEVDEVSRVLRSNRVSYWTGDECREFEREFAQWCGTPHAVALTNGTVALELALRALDVGPGHQVVVTPRTFLASASSIFLSPIVHEIGLTLAIVLGALALGHGALIHGFMMPAAIGALGLGVMAGAMNLGHGSEEILFTMLGVAILALGHDLNYRAGH